MYSVEFALRWERGSVETSRARYPVISISTGRLGHAELPALVEVEEGPNLPQPFGGSSRDRRSLKPPKRGFASFTSISSLLSPISGSLFASGGSLKLLDPELSPGA